MTEKTRAELQTYIDTNIRNETVDFAITPTEVATALQDVLDSVPGVFTETEASVVMDADAGTLRRGDSIVITDYPYRANSHYSYAFRDIKASISAGSSTLTWAAGPPSLVGFRNGNPLLILGAGNDPNLTPPDAPVVTVAGTAGSTSYDVCMVAATRQYGMSLPGTVTNVPNGPASLGAVDFLRVYKPATDHPEAYWYLIYGRRGTDPFRLWGAICAHELHGDAVSVGQEYPHRFDRKTMADASTKFFPTSINSTTRPNYLEAYVVAGEGTATFVLDRPAVSNAISTDVFPDLPLAIEDALYDRGTGAHIIVPPGQYCFPRGVDVFSRCVIESAGEGAKVEIIAGVTAFTLHSTRTGPVWQPAVPVRLGDRCWPNVSVQSTWGYRCVVEGVTGTSHPSFSTTENTVDGTVTWAPIETASDPVVVGHVIRGFEFAYWRNTLPCGPWCFWDDISISRVGDTTGGYWKGACLVSYTRCTFEKMAVSECIGYAVYSYSPGRIAAQANLSRFRDIRSGGNAGGCIVLDGYDNNSCTAQDCLSLGDLGTGYVDRSLSGGVWINCNVESGAKYSHQNVNNGMTLLYCYAEGPEIDVALGCVIGPSSFGRMSNRCWTGSNILGRPWECGQYSRIIETSPNPYIRIAPGNSPYVLEWGAKEEGHEYGIHCLYYTKATKEWAIMKNTGDAFTATMYMSARTLRKPWMIYWTNGIWVGDGKTNDVVHIVSFDGLPSYGLHKPGSLMIDRNTGAIYTAAANSGSASTSWIANHNYHRGTSINPLTPNGFVYQNTGADETRTGATEPSWPTTPGATVADGSTEWTCWGPNEVDAVNLVPEVHRFTPNIVAGAGSLLIGAVTMKVNSECEVTITWQAQDSAGNRYIRRIKNWIRRVGSTASAVEADTVVADDNASGTFTGSGSYTLTTSAINQIELRVTACSAYDSQWRISVELNRYPLVNYT